MADDLEHIRGSGLLLQQFPQLVEEPRVLDGDDGLIGEGLEQGDLSLGEELDLGAAQRDRADRDAFPHQGHAKDGVDTPASRVCAAFGKFVDLGLHISKMNGPPVEDGSARYRPADQRE